jgi:hypothetical protein
MRARKRSHGPSAAVVLAIANHAAMGVALGLVFTFILISVPVFGIRALIDASADPEMTLAVFVGTAVVMFGLGAALTGVILMADDA